MFLEPRVGDRPGHPHAAQVKKVKTLIKNKNYPPDGSHEYIGQVSEELGGGHGSTGSWARSASEVAEDRQEALRDFETDWGRNSVPQALNFVPNPSHNLSTPSWRSSATTEADLSHDSIGP